MAVPYIAQELAKRVVTNPNIVGPLLISAVGAQNADKIQQLFSSGDISFNDVFSILQGNLTSSILNQILDTPSGAVYAPSEQEIEAERKFNEELNRKIFLPPETSIEQIISTPETTTKPEPLITPDVPEQKTKVSDIGFTEAAAPKLEDFIMTVLEPSDSPSDEEKEIQERLKSKMFKEETILDFVKGNPNIDYKQEAIDKGGYISDAVGGKFWANYPADPFPGGETSYKNRVLTYMKPEDFLKLAEEKDFNSIESKTAFKLYENTNKGLSVPFLNGNLNEKGQIEIDGHEGRHRAEYVRRLDPDTPIPVYITVSAPSGQEQFVNQQTYNYGRSLTEAGDILLDADFINEEGKPVDVKILGYDIEGKKVGEIFTEDAINILPEEFTPKMKTDKPYSYVEAVNPQKVFGDKDLRNEDYTTKEAPKINYEFNNKTVEQVKNKTFEEFEEATGINAEELAKKFNFTMPDTSLLNNALQRDEKARYWWQQSGEFLDGLMTDLNLDDKERELFLEVVSTTSGGVNPKQNLEIALGVMSDVLAGRPIRMGFKTSQSLDVLLKDKDSKINSPKFRNYTDTFKYFAGTDDRLPNTTNDLQMAKIFGMNPETLANNPDLYALMTMTLNNLAENVNIKDPQDEPLQPFELQAMMWTESRGGRSTNFSEIGPQVLNELEKLGYDITKESITDPNFVRDLQKTVKPFEESIKMTVESGSFLSPQGQKIEQLIQSFPDDSVLMSSIDKVNRNANKSLITKSDKQPSIIEELVSQVVGQKVTMSRMIQGYGTFEGNVGDNVYIPSVYSNNKGQMVQLTDDQRKFVLSVLGKNLNQAATASSNFFTVEEGMEQPDAEVMQTTSFYVPNTKFDRKQLQEVHSLSGYDFNVVPVTGGFVLDTISFEGKPDNEKVEKALQTVFGKDLKVGIIDTVWYGDYIESNQYEENINDFIQNDTRADQEVELTAESFIDIFSKIENISKKRDEGYQAILDSTKVINLLKKNNIQLKRQGGFISIPKIPSLVNGGLVDINYLTRPINNGR